jgi:hypothetical protein
VEHWEDDRRRLEEKLELLRVVENDRPLSPEAESATDGLDVCQLARSAFRKGRDEAECGDRPSKRACRERAEARGVDAAAERKEIVSVGVEITIQRSDEKLAQAFAVLGAWHKLALRPGTRIPVNTRIDVPHPEVFSVMATWQEPDPFDRSSSVRQEAIGAHPDRRCKRIDLSTVGLEASQEFETRADHKRLP